MEDGSTASSVHCLNVWEPSQYELLTGSNGAVKLTTGPIPPHTAYVYALRVPTTTGGVGGPSYLGSNIHFTCGDELSGFECTDDKAVNITLSPHRVLDDGSFIVVHWDHDSIKVTQNDTEVESVNVGKGVHRIQLNPNLDGNDITVKLTV